MAETLSTSTTLRTEAQKFASKSTVAGDYKAGKLAQYADLLDRGTITEREAISAANRVIKAVVSVLNPAS